MRDMVDPMCEVFPKQVGCYYSRYGLGGGLDSRHGMCILCLNMINDKVFLFLWGWHYLLIFLGVFKMIVRVFQLASYKVRFFLVKLRMSQFFERNSHIKHIQHYIHFCSIGDWFILYQMSKNMNKRFLAEFLALLAMTVDPDPDITPEPITIHLSPEDIEKLKDLADASSTNSDDEKEKEEEEEEPKEGLMSKLDEDMEGTGGGGGGSGGGLSGKERNLIKLGKHAKSANKKAMMAAAAMRRKR